MGIRIPDPGTGKARPDAAGSDIATGGDSPLNQQTIERWQTKTATDRKDLHGNYACVLDDKNNAPFFNSPDYGGTFHIVTGASQAIKEALAPSPDSGRPELLVRLEFVGPDSVNPRKEKSLRVTGRLVDLLNRAGDLKLEIASQDEGAVPIGAVVQETQTPGWRLRSIAVSRKVEIVGEPEGNEFIPHIDVARLSLAKGLDPAQKHPYERLAAIKGCTLAVTVKADDNTFEVFGEVSGIERDSQGKVSGIKISRPGGTDRTLRPESLAIEGIREVAFDRILSNTEVEFGSYRVPQGARLEVDLIGISESPAGRFLGSLSSSDRDGEAASLVLETAEGIKIIPFHMVKSARVQAE